MKRLSFWLLATALLSCTDASLYGNKTVPNFANKMSLSAELCTEDASALDFPLKTLVIMDGSAAARTVDPTSRRAAALSLLIERFGGRNRDFGIIQFGEQARPLTAGFAADVATLDAAVDGVSVGLGDAQRSYLDALRTASTIIQDDILAATPGVRSRTRYLVVFVGYGPPAPALKQAWCQANNFDPNDGDCDDAFLRTFCPVDAAGQKSQDCERDLYQRTVDNLRRFALENGAQDLIFHAVSLTDDARANSVMQDLTLAGHGDLVRQKPELINFVQFGLGRAGARMLLRDVVVFNPVAVLRGGTMVPDSDGDGLADDEEVKIGTDPLRDDTDGDSLGDAIEIRLAGPGLPFDPKVAATPPECATIKDLAADTDLDGLRDCEEVVLRTDPTLADSDRDGLPDLVETRRNGNPLVDDRLEDTDQDGLLNGEELKSGLDVSRNNASDELEYEYRYRTVDEGAKLKLESVPPDPIGGVRVVGFAVDSPSGVGLLNFAPSPRPTLSWSEDAENLPAGKPVDVSAGGYFEIPSSTNKLMRVNIDKNLLPRDAQNFKLLVRTTLRSCFAFDARNITLVESAEVLKGRPGRGWNLLSVYLGQVPEGSPRGHTVYDLATVPVRFLKPDRKTPNQPIITLEQDAFVLVGGK